MATKTEMQERIDELERRNAQLDDVLNEQLDLYTTATRKQADLGREKAAAERRIADLETALTDALTQLSLLTLRLVVPDTFDRISKAMSK